MRILRRLNKISFHVFLYFYSILKKRPSLSKEQGSILILADLLLGDLAMAGYLIDHVRSCYPERKIVLLHKPSLAEAADLFDVSALVSADYLGWHTFLKLQKISPEGYGWVINIFSWKWLPILWALNYGIISSFWPSKKRSRYMLTDALYIPDQPIAVPDLIFKLLETPGHTKNEPIHSKEEIINGRFNRNFKLHNFKFDLLRDKKIKTIGKFIAIHVGASSSARLWPISLLDKILLILSKKNITIVFTGLKQSSSYMIGFYNLLNKYSNSINFLDIISQTTLIELLAIIHQSNALISIDTGVTHWARLMGTPNLSFIGQSDENLFGANSCLFSDSYHLASCYMECKDKKTFHSIYTPWVNTCSRHECRHPSVECLLNISETDLNLTIEKLLNTPKKSLEY